MTEKIFPSKSLSPSVGIIMGSESDLPIMKSAAETFDSFGVPYEMTVVSAHRTPHRAAQYASAAQKRGIKVIIAGAGGAAHLAGVVASLTTLPVIGVPIKTSTLNGLDSLLSTVQMPEGIPVAAVAINGSGNAALLACQILGLSNRKISAEFGRLKARMKTKVNSKAMELELAGYKKYLKKHRL
jgi:5-(carboxyamino)imidazole ribonucleotide mutase